MYSAMSSSSRSARPTRLLDDRMIGDDLLALDALSPPMSPSDSIGSYTTDEHQQYLVALDTIKHLRQRLVRRTNVIEDIRKFYLRDIVAMRHVIRQVLTDKEREEVWQQYEVNLPSIDFNEALKVHAPTDCEFQIKPCEMCGGQLELIRKDSDEVDKLKKLLKESKEREAKWREKLASLDGQIDVVAKEKAEAIKSHMEEVSLYSMQ